MSNIMNMGFKVLKWRLRGSPLPPPHVIKIRTINKIQDEYQVSTFIETGTFLGDMIEAQKGKFSSLHSIELSEELFTKAEARFAIDTNVTIHQGDSGKVLQLIIADLKDQAIFWLDGHYSGGYTALGDKECPILEELAAIFSGEITDQIILIDDARCFTGEGDYPTIDEITKIITDHNSNYTVRIENDIIIALPNN